MRRKSTARPIVISVRATEDTRDKLIALADDRRETQATVIETLVAEAPLKHRNTRTPKGEKSEQIS